MNSYAFTFGPDHTVEHAALGLGELHRGYVVVEAPTEQIAVGIAAGIFGRTASGAYRWAFHYHWEVFLAHRKAYPAGELLMIPWVLPAKEDWAAFAALSDKHEWDWGTEIELYSNFIHERRLVAELHTFAVKFADELEQEQDARDQASYVRETFDEGTIRGA